SALIQQMSDKKINESNSNWSGSYSLKGGITNPSVALASTLPNVNITATFAATAEVGVSWWLVPAACALACAFMLRALPEPARAVPEAGAAQGAAGYLGAVLRQPWALLVFGLAFVEGAILLGAMPFLAPALEHTGLDTAVAGLAITAYGLGLWLLSKLVKRLSGRWPTPLLMVVGGAQLCAGFALAAVHVSLATVAVTALLLGGGWSFLHSSLQTWATAVVPEARGTTIAFFASALFVGSAVASWAAGPLAEQGRYGLLFWLAAGAAIPLTAVAALTRRRYGALRAESPQPQPE
ncbi:MFS transporter, partial [Nonomuraea zeae]